MQNLIKNKSIEDTTYYMMTKAVAMLVVVSRSRVLRGNGCRSSVITIYEILCRFRSELLCLN